MALTKVVNGVMREFWIRDAVGGAQGPGTENVDTTIAISAGQLSRVQAFLSVTNVAGLPIYAPPPVLSVNAAGHLRVAVQNSGAPGSTATWTLDVALLSSSDQGKRAGAGYVTVVNGTPGLVGPQTLAVTYAIGAAAADQTMTILDADGGGIIVDASTAGATAASTVAMEIRQKDLDVPLPLLISRRGNFTNPGALVFEKARGTFTPNAPADVENLDLLGCIDFYGRVGGVQVLGAQIIGVCDGVIGGLRGGIEFYIKQAAGVATRAFKMLASPGAYHFIVTDTGTITPEVAPNTCSLGEVGLAWHTAYINTVNVYDNVCVGGVAAGVGADLTVALSNAAVGPGASVDLTHLYCVDWDGNAGEAALAIYAEKAVAALVAQVADTLIPVTYNGTAYWLVAYAEPQA